MKAFAHFITTYAKAIFAVWIVIFIAMAIFAVQLPSKLEGDGFFVDDEHVYVTDELAKNFDLPAKTIFVVFENRTNQEIEHTLALLKDVKDIDTIVSPVDDPALVKGKTSYAMLHFTHNITDYNPLVVEIRDILKNEKDTTLTGEPVFAYDVNMASQKDLAQAEAIGLPIAIIVLLLAFGTIMASVLPIFVGIIAVVTALGLLTIFSDYLSLSIFVLNIVPMLGLALSIDFSLLFINRYREEREQHNIATAVGIAIQTAGRSIIFSAICVMIGLGAMAVIDVEIFRNIAVGGSLVVFLAVIVGLTLLPATLVMLGDRLNKGRIFRPKAGGAKGWRTFAGFVMRFPVMITIVAFVLLGIGMIPIKDMELVIPKVDSLPKTYDSRLAFEKLSDEFDFGKTSTLYLLAERPDGWDHDSGYEKIAALEETLLKDQLVDKVDTIYSVANIEDAAALEQALNIPEMKAQLAPAWQQFVQGNQLFIPITLNVEGASSEAQTYTRNLMHADLGVDFTLGGVPKFNQEIFDEIYDNIGYALLIIMISTFIILMVAFRSILIPLKAILMNIIGLTSAFGILVYIFQYGHFGMEQSPIVLIIPVIVFCLVFGLSMDYEVFLISRIQEEYEKGASNTMATIDGLTATSRIITSAALIMIVLTGAFAFTDVMPVKQIGVGIAIAIAIDATIIRLMLVPSLMKLLGDWNWWYPFKRRTTK